jgi:hypothetical protein
MRKLAVLGTILSIFASSQVANSQLTPAPGAISASISVPSIQNIANVFVPILSYYMINNKTHDIGYVESSVLYKLDIESVHINTFDGFEQKEVAFLPGTNTLRVLFSGININMDIEGSIYALHVVPFHTSHCNITNITVQLDLAVQSQDDVKFQLL